MKNKKPKHYIGTIEERQGELEHDTRYVFTTAGCPDEYNDKVASTWRGDDDEEYNEDMGGYWSGDSVVSAGQTKEIHASDFAILKKYLAVL